MAGDRRMGDINTASFIEIENEWYEVVELVLFADSVRVRDKPHPCRIADPKRFHAPDAISGQCPIPPCSGRRRSSPIPGTCPHAEP